MKRWLLLAVWFGACMSAVAKDYTVYAGDIPPFCHEKDGAQAGILIDLLSAASRTGGFGFTVRFLPWKRAQAEARAADDVLIIPMTRTAEREASYRWIAPLLSYRFVIVTAGHRPPPRTIEEAKGWTIGVLRGNPMDAMLPRLGFTDVRPGDSEEAVAKLLRTRRIDAWVVADIVAADAYRRAGGDAEELAFGPRIGDAQWIFLAASPRFPDEDHRALGAAFERLRTSGEADRIVSRHRR